MLPKNEIPRKYKGKVLGFPDYKENTNYYIDQFSNEEWFRSFLYDVGREASITKEGYNFLIEFYGLDRIAVMILEEQSVSGTDLGLKDKSRVEIWLKECII